MTVYKGCAWVEHGVVFDHDNKVRECSLHNPDFGGRPNIWENYIGTTDWEDFFRIKREHREKFKSGEVLPQCNNCIALEERDWDNEDYINEILLTPWVECNSKCIYCTAISDNYTIANTKKYDVVNVMSSMIKNNVFSKDVHIDFAGGESTIYRDFEKLLRLFIDSGYKDISIHTNSIKHSRAIEKGIKKGALRMVVSLDAGTEEMHRRVKGVKSYKKVWDNLRKYAKVRPEINDSIITKYIIVPDVNDSKEELKKWLEINNKLEIPTVLLNVDHEWVTRNLNGDISQLRKLQELHDYTLEQAKELGIKMLKYPQIQQVLQRIHEYEAQV